MAPPCCSPEYLPVNKDFLDISSPQAPTRGGVLSALRRGLWAPAALSPALLTAGSRVPPRVGGNGSGRTTVAAGLCRCCLQQGLQLMLASERRAFNAHDFVAALLEAS